MRQSEVLQAPITVHARQYPAESGTASAHENVSLDLVTGFQFDRAGLIHKQQLTATVPDPALSSSVSTASATHRNVLRVR